jgi:hypothetical protein
VQRLLPLEQYQDVVRVAELSGYVRVIECLYKKRNFGAETSPIPLPESEAIKSKNISQDDAIKKAIVESILADYNVYVNSADKMRSEVRMHCVNVHSTFLLSTFARRENILSEISSTLLQFGIRDFVLSDISLRLSRKITGCGQ